VCSATLGYALLIINEKAMTVATNPSTMKAKIGSSKVSVLSFDIGNHQPLVLITQLGQVAQY